MKNATRELPLNNGAEACLSARAGEQHAPRLGKGTLGSELQFATQLIKH